MTAFALSAPVRVSPLLGVLSASTALTFGSSAPPPPPPPPPPSPAGGTRAFSLLSATGGTAVPFCVGFAFRKADIASGSGLVSDFGTLQVTPKNYWPDGSLKFAVLSGTADLTGGGSRTITLSAGTSSSGPALATTNLPSGIRTTGVSIGCGAFGTATWSGTDFDSPFATWVSGAIMSSWIYRKAVGSDAHLVAWLEVRLFDSGAVEVLPWIENGYLKVASPTNKSATYTFSLGGTVRNGGGSGSAIDLKHHTRTPLVSGAALSYWLGADPGITVKHDAAYLMSTELVPTYYATVDPGDALVTGLPSTYTPLQAGSIVYDTDSMASSGYQAPIGLLMQSDVIHLTTTADTYASVVRNGYSAGRYGIHYRDENTNKPVRFQDRPNLVIADFNGFKDNGSSTTGDRTTAATGGNPPTWDTAHSPSVGYLAYLITGRFYHLETVQFAATANYLGNGDNAFLRTGVSGLVQTSVNAWQTRSCAWDWRSKVQALTVTPDSGAGSECRQDLINCVEANVAHFYNRYVATTNNPFGLILPGENYDGSLNLVAIWQQDFVTAAFGWSVSMDLPIGTTPKTNLAAFFQWKAKSALITLGQFGESTEWPFQNSSPYVVKIGTAINSASFENGTGPWQADTGAMYTATQALTGGNEPTWFSATYGVLTFEFGPTPDEACKGTFGNRMPALAYAVRHGVTGAKAALYRLISAGNWPGIEAAFNSRPVWGVKPASGDLPSWRTDMAVNELKNLASAANTQGSPVHVWGSFVKVSETCTLVSPANGGHNDSADNRVTSIDLSDDSPAWTIRIASGTSFTSDVPYMPDGKPVSRHGYTHNHYVPQRKRVMLFGAEGAYSSGFQTYEVDGVRVSDWTWDCLNGTTAYAALAAGRGNGQGVDPLTGNVWTNAGWLWNQAANSWSQPGTQQITTAVSGASTRTPWAWDHAAQNFFALQWRDGRNGFGTGIVARQINRTTGAITAITFNSSSAYTTWLAEAPAYAAMVYDNHQDCFYFYSGQTNASDNEILSQVPGRIYKITKGVGTVWDMSILTITGDTPANVTKSVGQFGTGVNGRLLYIPQLKGIFCQPDRDTAPWFLRTY